MASIAIVAVNVAIPILDSGGSVVDYSGFIKNMVPLCQNNLGFNSGQLDAFDNVFNFAGQYTTFLFFLLATNEVAALNLYNTFKASLATGTATYVWYSAQTLGT